MKLPYRYKTSNNNLLKIRSIHDKFFREIIEETQY